MADGDPVKPIQNLMRDCWEGGGGGQRAAVKFNVTKQILNVLV